MDAAARRAMIYSAPNALVGIADPAIAQRLVREAEQFVRFRPVVIATTLDQLREAAARTQPAAILLDDELLHGQPLADSLRQFLAIAPVILLAPVDRLAEAARHVAAGEIEFVARVGDFVPLAAALIERRLRWTEMSESLLAASWKKLPADRGENIRIISARRTTARERKHYEETN
jgi:hypothetical protein